ncbi:MAG: hypothetical protein Q9216_003385 [Gyalolechia sp. 2 TL-2023]
MAMEIVTVVFPIYQTVKHKRAARETNRILAVFDQKRLGGSSNNSVTLTSSMATSSLAAKPNGKMCTMDSLDECLASDDNGLQLYASCIELNGENIIFLKRAMAFKRLCSHALQSTTGPEFRRARMSMFRQALEIFITLVHAGTATYPINIESPIYSHLDAVFGPATALVAVCMKNSTRTPSISGSSNVTPWEEQHQQPSSSQATSPADEFPSFPMHALPKQFRKSTNRGNNNNSSSSSEHIVPVLLTTTNDDTPQNTNLHDPLSDIKIPPSFDATVFDAAIKSIRYMVWSETWQRYCVWKQEQDRGAQRSSIVHTNMT